MGQAMKRMYWKSLVVVGGRKRGQIRNKENSELMIHKRKIATGCLILQYSVDAAPVLSKVYVAFLGNEAKP